MPTDTPVIATTNVIQLIISMIFHVGVLKNKFDKLRWNVVSSYHDEKDCYTIEFYFSNGNSKYSDEIVLYKDGTNFNIEEFKKDIDAIIERAEKLFN